MKVLVCGGRDYDAQKVEDWLDKFDLHGPNIDCIIEGGAMGADFGAQIWAMKCSKQLETYYADWDKHGRSAGPIRNKQMLTEGKPDLAVAFPGGKGTANMIKQAKEANVEVIEV